MLNEDRICELLAEAEADLASYDALRENTLEMIKTYKKRLDLLGSKSKAMILPGVELPMPPKSEKPKPLPTVEGLSNKDLFASVLIEAGPLKAKDVWPRAMRLGATSTSSNPIRTTDSVLREMVKQGRLVQVGPGEFAAKPQ